MTPLIREAKNVLMSYRRLTRLTGRFYSLDELYRLTPESFFNEATEPYGGDGSCLQNRLAIIKSWQTLIRKEQEVLYYAYLAQEAIRMSEIADKMGYSLKSVEKFKAQGSKNFIQAFKSQVHPDCG